jgi:hypothetical protein
MIRPLLLMTVFCSLWPQSARVRAASAEWAREVRVLYEVSHFDFARIDEPPDRPWGILRVLRPQSFDDSLELIRPLRPGPDLDLIDGVVVRAIPLKGSVPHDDTWRCLVPVPARFTFGTRPIYMVDRNPGMCICRLGVDPNGSNTTALEEVHLIPDRWADKVGPAVDRWRSQRDLFAAGDNAGNQKHLAALLKDDNPVLALIAAEALAANGALSTDQIPRGLFGAKDDLGVVVDYLLLSHCSKSSADRVANALGGQIDAAVSTADLHGIATACALDLPTAGDPRGRASYSLLKLIDSGAAVISNDQIPDQYLAGALEVLKQLRHRAAMLEKMKKGGQ